VPRKTSAPRQGPGQQGRRDATPNTLALPLQPATAPRRRVDRTCYCSIPHCATAAHGWRARGRLSLATTSCLWNNKQTSAARFNTPHKRAHKEQQHTSRGNTAGARTRVGHRAKFSSVVRNTPGPPTHAHRALAGTAPHCQKLCRTDETSGLQAGARHDSHLRKHVPAQRVLEEQLDAPQSHCAQDRTASLCRNSDSPSRLRLKPA